MEKKKRVETVSGFSRFSIYSQIAGICAISITNFLEITKIRLIQDTLQCSEVHYQQKLFSRQILEKLTQKSTKISPNITEKCLRCLPNRSGILTLKYLYDTHGLLHVLTKGLVATINSSIIRVGLFFPIMDFFRAKIERVPMFKNRNQIWTTMTSSGLARFIATLASFPFEVSKIKQQSDSFRGLNIFQSMKIIIKNPKKYSSVFLTFFQRELFFTFIFWTQFDIFKMYFANLYNRSQEDFVIKLPTAFLAGLLSSIITYPFDLIQTNMILDPKQSSNGSFKILKNLYTNYGVSSLMNGLSVRMLRGGLNIVIFFTVYDSMKHWDKLYFTK